MSLNNKNRKIRLNLWQFVIGIGFVVFLSIAIVFFFLGRLNADEGWYLYASKLVYLGKIPYKDFAYTQMPLLPYIYGLPQFIFPSSIYLGRLTSLIILLGNFIVGVKVANKYGGLTAMGIAALLFATFSYGLYFSVIVKTYALLALLFTLTFAALSLDSNKSSKYVLPVIFSLCAALVRLSAVFFAVPIIIYSYFWALRKKDKGSILLVILVAFLFFLRFYLADVEAAQWNLLTYHTSQWGDETIPFKLREIGRFRIPTFLQGFGTYLVVTAVSFGTLIRSAFQKNFQHKSNWQGRLSTLIFEQESQTEIQTVMLIGLVAFAASHLASGSWHIEYVVPALIGLFPLLAIAIVKAYAEIRSYFFARILFTTMVISVLIAELIRGFIAPIDIADGRLPVQEVREAAALVAAASEPTDQLLILEALWLAVDSDRYTLPGFSMAQFSYVNMDSTKAQRLNEVNYDMILDAIVTRKAEIVVFTDHDWQLLQTGGDVDVLRNELTYRYKLILEQESFGMSGDTLHIYQRY